MAYLILRLPVARNSSSFILNQTVLISLSFQAKKEMRRRVAGWAINPYGQDSPVQIDMNIHSREPTKNRQVIK